MSEPVIEGRNAVAEALRSGMPVRAVLLGEGVSGGPIDEIERLARAAGASLKRVPRSALDAQSERGAHQGVIAQVHPFKYADIDEIIRHTEGRSRALIVALDNVTDAGNLGAIARSIEVAGGEALLVTKRRSAAIGPGAYKTSAGALAYLPVVQEPNLVRALERLKKAGFWIAGAEAHGAQEAWEAPLDGRLVLVLGSEGGGLSRLTREACDFLVRLPVAGKVDSLNVAQAATVLAFEWVRRGTGQR